MGYYVVFRVRQLELKSEVHHYLKSHIDDRSVTRLQFAMENSKICDERFKWQDEREFEFAGSMYDILDSKIENNTITIYCLRDDKENELLNSFAEMLRKQNSDKGKSGLLFQFFASLYTIPQEPAIPTATLTGLFSYGYYSTFLLDRTSEIITPPPQHC